METWTNQLCVDAQTDGDKIVVVNFVDEKASRFHTFQQGKAAIRHLIQSEESKINCFPHVSITP
jgi:hypothetical protein